MFAFQIFKAMKEKILTYFKHDRSHTGGVKLYNEVGNRISLKRQLNVQPEDPHLTSVLHEELRVIGEISMDEFRVIMRNPITSFQETSGNPPEAPAKQKPAGKGKKPATKKPAGKGKKQATKKPAGKKEAPKLPPEVAPVTPPEPIE